MKINYKIKDISIHREGKATLKELARQFKVTETEDYLCKQEEIIKKEQLLRNNPFPLFSNPNKKEIIGEVSQTPSIKHENNSRGHWAANLIYKKAKQPKNDEKLVEAYGIFGQGKDFYKLQS